MIPDQALKDQSRLAVEFLDPSERLRSLNLHQGVY
jgi:hypothetical protein